MILSKDEFQKRNDKEDSTIYITRKMVEESAGQIKVIITTLNQNQNKLDVIISLI